MRSDGVAVKVSIAATGTASKAFPHPDCRAQTIQIVALHACPVGRVPAAEIEAAVIDQLRGVFRQPEIVAGTWGAARAQETDVTEGEVREALQQLDSLWDELFPAEQARRAAAGREAGRG